MNRNLIAAVILTAAIPFTVLAQEKKQPTYHDNPPKGTFTDDPTAKKAPTYYDNAPWFAPDSSVEKVAIAIKAVQLGDLRGMDEKQLKTFKAELHHLITMIDAEMKSRTYDYEKVYDYERIPKDKLSTGGELTGPDFKK